MTALAARPTHHALTDHQAITEALLWLWWLLARWTGLGVLVARVRRGEQPMPGRAGANVEYAGELAAMRPDAPTEPLPLLCGDTAELFSLPERYQMTDTQEWRGGELLWPTA